MLLTTVAIALWIRSSFRADQIRLNDNNGCWQVSTERNQLSIEHAIQPDEKFPMGWSYRGFPNVDRFDSPAHTTSYFNFLGFGFYTWDYPRISLHTTALVIPFWFLGSLFCLPFVKYIIDSRRRKVTKVRPARHRDATRVLNLTTVISLVLCVPAILLWYRSRDVSDNINLRWERGVATLGTIDGAFTFVVATRNQPKVPIRRFVIGTLPYATLSELEYGAEASDPNTYFEWAGFFVWHYHHPSDPSPTRVAVVVPCWFFLMLLLIIPGTRLFLSLRARSCRRRRLKAGLCWRCGYSLTGNHSGICPECGAQTSGLDVACGQSSAPNASAYSSGSADT